MKATTHVLFDFFGTLVAYSDSRVSQGFQRSHRVLVAAGARVSYEEFLGQWEATFEEFERRAQRSLDEYAMDDVCRLFLERQLGRAPPAGTVASFRDTYLDEWNEGVQYIPGVSGLLAALARHFTLALVTNTHHAELVDRHLRAIDAAQYFTAIITSVEHGKRKPSRCIFERAVSRSGGACATSVYVGDSFSADYQGALAAGLRCLLIDPECRHNIPDDHRLANIFEAPARLDMLRAG